MQAQYQQMDQMSDYRIPIYSPMHHSEQLALTISREQLRSTTITDLKQRTIKMLGYASRIYLYVQPITTYNCLNFYNDSEVTVLEVINSLSVSDNNFQEEETDQNNSIRLAILYNNTQYRQEPESKAKMNNPKQESYQIVLQIIQNNYFVDQSYRIQVDNKISFLKSMANRYGRSYWLEYYNTRLQLSNFGDSQLKTLIKWIHSPGKIIVSVERDPENIEVKGKIREVNSILKINLQKFYILQWNDQNKLRKFVISRNSNLDSISRIFEIIYRIKFIFRLYEKEPWVEPKQLCNLIKNQVNIIHMKPNQNLFPSLEIFPISFCQILPHPPQINYSQKNKLTLAVSLIELSSVLHRLQLIQSASSFTLCHHHQRQLPCIPTQYLDQDLYYIRKCNRTNKNIVIGYSITIHGISVKQYTTNGQIIQTKIYKWNNGNIQFVVNDFFCVKTKQNVDKATKLNPKITKNQSFSPCLNIFYIHDPDNFLSFNNIGIDKFFPARVGFNACSDGSGLFVLWDRWSSKISIYQFPQSKILNNTPQKYKLNQITIETNNHKITNIFFSKFRGLNEKRLLCINYQDKELQVYRVNGDKLINILCQKRMKNIFFLGEKIMSCADSSLYTFDLSKNKQWCQPQFIPQNHAIIDVSDQQIVNPVQNLQFQNLEGFYFINSDQDK